MGSQSWGIVLDELEAIIDIIEAGSYTYEDVEVKRWIADGDACEDCDDAAEQGWIDMDAGWDSGQFGIVDEPPMHTNCRCTVEYSTKRKRVYDD